MPSPFSGIIQDQRLRDSRAIAQQDAILRMMEMRARQREAEEYRRQWGLYQNQNSPAAAKERRLAAHQKLTENQKLAWSNYFLTMKESEVPQEARQKFRNLQNVVSADPIRYADVAMRMVQQMKPHAIQRLTSQTIDDEGNPINAYEIYDPNNPGLGSMPDFGGGLSSPIGGGGGTRPAAAAPTLPTRVARPKSRIEKLTDHFMSPPPEEAPPPAPMGAGPPAGWED